MRDFRRPHHRAVARALKSLNAELLEEAECFFGGGTHLTMSYGEYRESRDVDFLCSTRKGFRILREQVSERSLGKILRAPLPLASEVRADHYGIRTFLEIDAMRIKFEIVLEARIDLAGRLDRDLSVPALTVEHAIAEKLLANADRGLDASTLSRDIVDLAFVAVGVGKPALRDGLAIAEQAYGKAVRRSLRVALDAFRQNRTRANACIRSLAIEDTARLRKGLRILRTMIA
jgi:hypothetical protein